MPKRIDPIRHWSIALFIVLAVGICVLLLPPISRYFGWNLDVKSRRDLRYTALAIAVTFTVTFLLWRELLDFLQDWRDKRAARKKNPYDQL